MNSPAEGVLEISDREGSSVKLVMDDKTGLPAKEVYREAGPVGAPASMEEVFEEFEDAGGIQAPKSITVNRDGKKYAGLTITQYKVNSGIKTEDINKKP